MFTIKERNFKYVLVKFDQNIAKDDYEEFLFALNEGLNPYLVEKLEENVISIFFDCSIDSYEIFSVMKYELFINVIVFESRKMNNDEKDFDYYNWTINEFRYLLIKADNFYYDEKKLVRENLVKNTSNETKKYVLKELWNDNETINFLKVFFECSLNTSKAADLLYLHRNTLINRLDKFYQITGYDVRKFEDAVIIYYLMNN